MICKNCGMENEEGVKFCRSCGNPITETPAAEAATQAAPAAEAVQMNSQPMGQPGVMNGAPMQPMGQPGAMNGAPMQPMGGPGGMQAGMQAGMPMQSAPMYQMPPTQAVPPAEPKKSNGGVKALIIIIVVLLVGCVGGLAALGISKNSKQAQFESLLGKAEASREDQEFEEAEDYYLQALEINEDDKDAINGLTNTYIDWANSLAEDGDYEKALKVLKNADSQANKKKIDAAIAEIEAAMESANSGGPSQEEDDWYHQEEEEKEDDWYYEEEEEEDDPYYEEEYDWLSVGYYGWSDADFVVNGPERFVAANGDVIAIWDGELNWTHLDYSDGGSGYGTFATARGLETGMSIYDYQYLYPVSYGYAIWEVIDYYGTTYLNYYSYEDPADVYEIEDLEVYNVYLDLGWCKEGGTWRILTDDELWDVWFCDAPLANYDEIAILSVGLDNYNDVFSIFLYHSFYDEDWVYYQDWAE